MNDHRISSRRPNATRARRTLLLASIVGASTVAACHEDHEVEWETTRLVSADETCPGEDGVALQDGAEDASLEETVPVVLPPLCWYRVEPTSEVFLCDGWTRLPSLDEAREEAPDDFRPSDRGLDDPRAGEIVCTAEGPVLVWQATGAICPDAVRPQDWAGRPGVDEWWDVMEPKELLAVDQRPRLRACIYGLSREGRASGSSCLRGGWPSPQ